MTLVTDDARNGGIRFGSVCSGIEAASVAWHGLGWTTEFVSEIDSFPCAVLDARLPDVPNFGDMTKFEEWPDVTIDLLVGGTPCQSFSIAGLRAGLADPRGNLMLTYLAIARRYRPRRLVWENVPGVLSSNSGRDFATFLGACTGQRIEPPPDGWKSAGIVAPASRYAYGLAWRVLDAQFVRVDSHPRAVPQRRRRVFVVGYLGDWRPAAAVLFERESMQGHPPPRREARKGIAGTLDRGAGIRGQPEADRSHLIPEVANPLTERMHKGVNTTADEGQTMIAHAEGVAPALSESGGHARPGDNVQSAKSLLPVQVSAPLTSGMASSANRDPGEQGALVPEERQPQGFYANESGRDPLPSSGVSPPIKVGSHHGGQPPAVAFKPAHYTRDKDGAPDNIYPPLSADADRGDQDPVIAVQERATSENAANGPDGVGIRHDGASYTLEARQVLQAVAFDMRGREGGSMPEGPRDTANLRAASGGSSRSYVAADWAVRRLTPRECERLQGFPDDWTLIPTDRRNFKLEEVEMREYFRRTSQFLMEVAPGRWEFEEAAFQRDWPKLAADGPRYRALGNSMAINVMRWIGQRIEAVDRIMRDEGLLK